MTGHILRALVSGLVMGTVGSAAGGVFDDVSMWFNGAVDANGDAVFQQGELRDIRHQAAAQHAYHNAQLASKNADTITIVRENVICPYRNTTLFDVPCLGFPQTATTNGTVTVDGVEYPVVTHSPNGILLPNPLAHLDNSTTCTTYTAVMRFRYDEPVSRIYQHHSTVMQLGFGWSENSGLSIRITQGSGDPPGRSAYGARRLGFNCGQFGSTDVGYSSLDKGGHRMEPWIYPGSWVDLAVRVQGQNVTLAYTWNDSQGGTVAATNRHLRIWTVHIQDSKYNPGILPGKRVFRLGYESVNGSPITFTNGYTNAYVNLNALKSLRGCVQQFAFWTRALSDEEIGEAFGYPRPGLARLGLADGTANEFAATQSAVHIDGLWQNLDPKLDATVPREVSFTADSSMAGLPQYLRVAFATRPSARPRPAVSLNGTPLTRIESDNAARAIWYVPRDLVVAGTNTLSFLRTDAGTGDLTLDTLELGGSWLCGGQEGNADSYFVHENYGNRVFHLTDGNTFHFKRGVSGVNENRFDEIVYPLAEGVGGKRSATFSIYSDLISGDVNELSLTVNGTPLGSAGVTKHEWTTWKIPAEALHEGKNSILLEKAAQQGWMNIRAHRFVLEPLPYGMVMLIR